MHSCEPSLNSALLRIGLNRSPISPLPRTALRHARVRRHD